MGNHYGRLLGRRHRYCDETANRSDKARHISCPVVIPFSIHLSCPLDHMDLES